MTQPAPYWPTSCAGPGNDKRFGILDSDSWLLTSGFFGRGFPMSWSRFSRFLFLSAINCQVTVIIVESWLFRGFRAWAQQRSDWLGRLVNCDLCFGTWVGLVLALVYRPSLVEAPRVGTPWPAIDDVLQGAAMVAADAFAIALGGRAANEILGLLSREVSVREEEKELLAEEVKILAPSTSPDGGDG
jgi:hypothetical protein